MAREKCKPEREGSAIGTIVGGVVTVVVAVTVDVGTVRKPSETVGTGVGVEIGRGVTVAVGVSVGCAVTDGVGDPVGSDTPSSVDETAQPLSSRSRNGNTASQRKRMSRDRLMPLLYLIRVLPLAVWVDRQTKWFQGGWTHSYSYQ